MIKRQLKPRQFEPHWRSCHSIIDRSRHLLRSATVLAYVRVIARLLSVAAADPQWARHLSSAPFLPVIIGSPLTPVRPFGSIWWCHYAAFVVASTLEGIGMIGVDNNGCRLTEYTGIEIQVLLALEKQKRK